MVRDNAVRPVYDSVGNRQFSQTGRWLQMICDDALVYVDGWPLIPERGRVDIAGLVAEASQSVWIASAGDRDESGRVEGVVRAGADVVVDQLVVVASVCGVAGARAG